jgi:hypothetical protein
MLDASCSFRSFACAFTLVFAPVACGGSVPPADASRQAVGARDEPSASKDAGPAVEAAQPAGSPLSTEAVVESGRTLDLRFTQDGGLTLDGLPLAEQAGSSELQKRLGAPSREKAYPNGDLGHFYDERGLVLWTAAGKLKGVGVNFNWDGDEAFPKTSFTGSLRVGGLSVDRNTTVAQFRALDGVAVSCVMDDAMCGELTQNTRFLAGFEKTVITQVMFMLAKKSP